MDFTLEFLDLMFPGDEDLGMPSFSGIAPHLIERLDQEAHSFFVEIENIIIPELRFENSLDLLAYSRKHLPITMRKVTTVAIQNYFADPKVIASLRKGEAVLFPHPRVLPEINYELLEPVMELYSEGLD